MAISENICNPHRLSSSQDADLTKSEGFTLVELLVGAVILAISTLLVLSIFTVSTRFTGESKVINAKEALVEADLSAVEDELAKISYCDGTQKLLTSCNGQGPGGEAFYAPVVSGSPTIIDTMEEDCDNGNIISEVSGAPSVAISALRSLAAPDGITRSISVYDPSGPSATNSTIHTVLVTYSYSRYSGQNVTKSYLLRAPVANYCP